MLHSIPMKKRWSYIVEQFTNREKNMNALEKKPLIEFYSVVNTVTIFAVYSPLLWERSVLRFTTPGLVSRDFPRTRKP